MFDNIVFRQLFDATSSTYTYLAGDPQSREAVIIDTVFEQHFRDRALVEELGLKLLAVLDTHCHADHVTGAWLMQQATGCRIGISQRCAHRRGRTFASIMATGSLSGNAIWKCARRPDIPTAASPTSPTTTAWRLPATVC